MYSYEFYRDHPSELTELVLKIGAVERLGPEEDQRFQMSLKGYAIAFAVLGALLVTLHNNPEADNDALDELASAADLVIDIWIVNERLRAKQQAM